MGSKILILLILCYLPVLTWHFFIKIDISVDTMYIYMADICLVLVPLTHWYLTEKVFFDQISSSHPVKIYFANLKSLNLFNRKFILVFNYFIWSMIQRGSDTSFSKLWRQYKYSIIIYNNWIEKEWDFNNPEAHLVIKPPAYIFIYSILFMFIYKMK